MLRYLSIVLMLVLSLPASGNAALPTAHEPLPFIRARDALLVDPAGSPVILKGCNLGNWFLLEPWMFGGCLEARDQAQIFSTLAARFGTERRDQLLDRYRDAYITLRD